MKSHYIFKRIIHTIFIHLDIMGCCTSENDGGIMVNKDQIRNERVNKKLIDKGCKALYNMPNYFNMAS